MALGCNEILKLTETKLMRPVKILNVIRLKWQLFVNAMAQRLLHERMKFSMYGGGK